jgi:hypothetical protein
MSNVYTEARLLELQEEEAEIKRHEQSLLEQKDVVNRELSSLYNHESDALTNPIKVYYSIIALECLTS